ncbi:MAG: hypothetical protein M0Z70_06660 [Nitrospiraceae bacterium]|jgi:hypothetical protein|nr:hypothetical protein [Nitrospiraceae bacterium]
MLRNLPSFSEDGKTEYKPIDYNGLLLKTLIDIETTIPRVVSSLITDPGAVNILFEYIRTLWIFSKHYARVSQQEAIEKEFEYLNKLESRVVGRQQVSYIVFQRCMRIFDAVMEVLRENDKLEHLNLHGSIR